MHNHNLKTKFIYAIKAETDAGIILVIANSSTAKEGKIAFLLLGRIIEQSTAT